MKGERVGVELGSSEGGSSWGQARLVLVFGRAHRAIATKHSILPMRAIERSGRAATALEKDS